MATRFGLPFSTTSDLMIEKQKCWLVYQGITCWLDGIEETFITLRKEMEPLTSMCVCVCVYVCMTLLIIISSYSTFACECRDVDPEEKQCW